MDLNSSNDPKDPGACLWQSLGPMLVGRRLSRWRQPAVFWRRQQPTCSTWMPCCIAESFLCLFAFGREIVMTIIKSLAFGGATLAANLFPLGGPAGLNAVCSNPRECSTSCCIALYLLWLGRLHKELLIKVIFWRGWELLTQAAFQILACPDLTTSKNQNYGGPGPV